MTRSFHEIESPSEPGRFTQQPHPHNTTTDHSPRTHPAHSKPHPAAEPPQAMHRHSRPHRARQPVRSRRGPPPAARASRPPRWCPRRASRRLGAPVDTDGALTACSPRRHPRSRTSSDGRRNQLAAVQRRPLSLRSPAMRPTSAEGFRSEADGMPRTHGPWPSIAASRTAARSRVRQVACLVRRPTGWRPEPCTADPRHPYLVHPPLPPCNYSLERVHRRPAAPPVTGTLSDEHEWTASTVRWV